MTIAFIRGLWGDLLPNDSNSVLRRRSQLHSNITKEASSMVSYMTYVFGTENKLYLDRLQIKNKLLSSASSEWDVATQCYRHKIEIIRRALDDYSSVIWLDWDCSPTQYMPENFYDKISKGSGLKACLQRYSQRMCPWRPSGAKRILPNGGFIYVANKGIGDRLIECWEETGKHCNDEVALAKLTDRMNVKDFDNELVVRRYHGSWGGIDNYIRYFEPYCVSLENRRAICPESFEKQILFRHI